MCPAKKRRSTLQRRVIMEELKKNENHPTASELYEIVRRRLGDISLGTVYRNLVLLSDMGIIQKLALMGSETRFDGKLEHHYHVQCIHCGKVDDLHGLPSELLVKLPKKHNDFLITGHRLVFYGICSKCQQEGD
ncbi:MAG: transcriptional repressor [Pirellulales bacterium]|nr:transcriptional repressor [Pirellulales bacterium]